MYCINPDSDEPIFCIFDQIGQNEEALHEPYVNGNDFAKELMYMDGEGKKRIQIWINSEGGNVKEGMSICSAILQTKTKVDVLVIGIAYSIAGVIALTGRKIEMMDFSTLMFHMAYNPDGTEDKGLDIVNQSLITAISGRSGKSEEEVKVLMAATTFYTAQEAEKEGLISKGGVITCADSNKPRATADTKAKKEFGIKNMKMRAVLNKLPFLNKEELDKILNRTTTPKIKHMKTVAKALGLNEEASEEAISLEIAKTQNKSKNDDEEMKNLKAAAKKAEDALAEFTKKKDEDDAAARAKAKKDEEAASAKAKDAFATNAKAKIELTIKNKGLKVSDKEIANYVDFAGTTEEGLKKVVETIEAIPTTKKSPVIGAINKDAVDKLGIPHIDVAGTDEQGNPIAGDTTKMINAINSYKFPKTR